MFRRVVRHSFALLNVDHVQLNNKWNYSNVLSPYYRLYYIDAGAGCISNSDGTWILEAGYMYLIPSYTLCALHCEDFLSQYFIHFFEETKDGISVFHNARTIYKVKATDMDILLNKRLLEINPGRKINRSDNPKVYEKSVYYQEYEELNNKQRYDQFLETQGIILQLLSKFAGFREHHHQQLSAIPSKVVDLLGYIEVNLAQSLSVNGLAKIVNLHPDYVSRLFVKLTGERPLSYIHTKRIERSQYLMVTTDLSLSEIAGATGFENLPHFSKVFKAKTKLSPGQFRELNSMI